MLQDYVCIDLETTGLNPKGDRIIEIGAVKVREGQKTETLQILINPERRVEPRVQELTGISEKELEHCPVLEEVFPKIQEFLGEDILLGHHLMFDYSFLKRAYVNRKLPFERKGIDTLKLARRYLPELPSRGLGALCQHYGIEHTAHRALGDVLATVALYEHLKEQFYEEVFFAPRELVYKVKKEGPITRAQKEQLYLLLDKHKIVPDYVVESLTKNEASRYLDQIRAAYGR